MGAQLTSSSGTKLVVLLPSASQAKVHDLVTELNGRKKQNLFIFLESNRSLESIDFTDSVVLTNTNIKFLSKKIQKLSSPPSLTEISIALTKAFEAISPNALFFDSVSAILPFWDIKTTKRFVVFVLNKLHFLGINDAIVIIQGSKENTEIIRDLSPLFDTTVQL